MERLKQAYSIVEGVQDKLASVADAPLAPLARRKLMEDAVKDLEMAKVSLNDFITDEEAGDEDGEDTED